MKWENRQFIIMKTIYPGEARDRCKERGTLMNRIYKVVWNAARNAYVVGSEFIHSSRRVGGVER